jgi:hypothetical protein
MKVFEVTFLPLHISWKIKFFLGGEGIKENGGGGEFNYDKLQELLKIP